LGLQSTFNFVVPFISASDFRYNTVSVSTALNSDGWFTVWLLNPLTYPPNSPPTQQIVVMLSAGADFTYRLPITPQLAQGDGQGPHDNMECGEVSDHDASLISGHSVSLPTPHTNVQFFFDRYRFIGVVVSTVKNAPKPVSYLNGSKVKNIGAFFQTDNNKKPYSLISLSPVPSLCGVPISSILYAKRQNPSVKIAKLTAGDDFLYQCCPFTYVKFDLEFTVVPPMEFDTDYIVHWTPPGGTIAKMELMVGTSSSSAGNIDDLGENRSESLLSTNPTFFGRKGAKVSAVIPFCL
ncbi:capsid protein VP1, partial [cosavirus A11]